jgi:hypothetical protein
MVTATRSFLPMGQLNMTADPSTLWTRFPVAVLIIDVDDEHGTVQWNGMSIQTPEPSKPYIGQVGTAERVADPDPEMGIFDTVRITMPDGHVLWGWECWWAPVETRPVA